MNENKQLFVTSDGSKTYYLPEFDEYYHSHHGAVQEARHVFLKHGLADFPGNSELSVLEIGFGSGLNALLTAIEAEKQALLVSYFGLEAFPLNATEAENLSYTDFEDLQQHKTLFATLHLTPWEELNTVSPNFRLQKIKAPLRDLKLSETSIDLIYFDAFGPRVQPEMWTVEVFEKLFAFLKPGGILVTYCAKGQVKRDLKAVGFEVETLPGPPGKREMVRARKN